MGREEARGELRDRGRDNGYSVKDRRTVLLSVAGAYRSAMRQFAAMTNLDVWYTRLDAATLLAEMKDQLDRRAQRRSEATVAKARTGTACRRSTS